MCNWADILRQEQIKTIQVEFECTELYRETCLGCSNLRCGCHPDHI